MCIRDRSRAASILPSSFNERSASDISLTYSSQKQICLSKATIAMWEVAPTEKVFWLSTNSLLFVAFCRSIDLSLRNFDTPTDTGPTNGGTDQAYDDCWPVHKLR